MVTPDRRRIAVVRIQERFGVSERRACAVVDQHRSTQRRPKAAPSRAEAELREHLRDFSRCHPRLGWRKAHVLVAPVVDRLARHTELLGNLSDRTTGLDQIQHLAAELRWITPWHDDLLAVDTPEIQSP